ncbi:MAG: FAD-dependent oxidoreductase [Bacteroidota bacterium]|nr:FAD-dependent oxidoreductase [Bacteroidota bacterium]
MPKNVNHSYWENKFLFKKFDLIIIGSGIVGLSTAISFKQKNKKATVLVLEKGILPSGASTKNAGFACFGSVSELLDDLSKMNDETVWQTVEMRWNGLKLLRQRLGDKHIDYKALGGYELFDKEENYSNCVNKIDELNKKITTIIGQKKCYSTLSPKKLNFKNIKGVILNQYEGQIDTSLMTNNLLSFARDLGITVLNSISVLKINSLLDSVELLSDFGIFKATKVVVATNGFAKELLNIPDVKPARAQVLITKPIKNLKIKGAFHYQEGYYYFRNIDDRVLFGGGRNLDFKEETTTLLELNNTIQKQLDYLLKEMILPDTKFEVDYRWSGIMGIGSEKKPIIKLVHPNVLAAVRMGGMGIAIGSIVGQDAANKIS